MAEVKITKRAEDYSRWYTDVIAAAELADYAPVKGCMIIRPNGYAIWEKMQQALDKMFKETGHQNAYFPLFIPEHFLHKEAQHVEGFAPEVAVVTHGGGEKLEEPLIVRPTSETIIWNTYRNWIQSYRDLPLLLNQWANVVRWEMRTRLFLRTTEFLWQEGHTAHATYEEAEEETLRILHVYKTFAEEYMALPVIEGRKTEREKFAGADHTYSIEAMMGDGKALQAGTSHHLAQNFAKAFDVTFQTQQGTREHVYATSWGLSTRMIGALIMAHGDDNGIVIPPRLASTQLAIVPIFRKPEERSRVMEAANRIAASLKEAGVALKVDDRDQYSPGWKFNDWEKRGVPLRIELGPKDLDKNQVTLARRDTGEKAPASQDGLTQGIVEKLDAIQKSLFTKARDFREQNTHVIDAYDQFNGILDRSGGFLWSRWCGADACEERAKNETKATIRCIPSGRQPDAGPCIICGAPSEGRVIFARAY
jgi:prolyl-tRNA synthetase